MDEYLDSLPEEQAEPEKEKTAVASATVCDIQFREGSKVYYFDPNGIDPKVGDKVVIDTARGDEYGICTGAKHTVTVSELVLPLRRVLRLATERDEQINAENKEKEKRAYAVCLEKIDALALDMQLVSVECAFDGSKLLFYFTADARVDFRELVKQLASVFHTRIELRQIGVRDKAKMVGGFGICGRPFCCTQFLDDFQPVSIKMAKTQNLSLNPAKISGTCGRLMCCLKYEQDAYEDLLKTSPKAESFVDTPDGRGTVTDVNLMAQTVKVRMESDPDEIKCYRNCDICVLRNGRAKKTDQPIPEDLAPLSGGNKPEPAQESYPRFERRRTAAAIAALEGNAELPAVTADRKRRERRPEPENETGEEQPAAEQKPAKKQGGKKPGKKPEPAKEKPAENKPAEGNRQPAKEKQPQQKSGKEKQAQKPQPAKPENRQGQEKPAAQNKPHSGKKHGGQKQAPKLKENPEQPAQKQEKQAPKPQPAKEKPAENKSAPETAGEPKEQSAAKKKKRYYHHYRKPQ